MFRLAIALSLFVGFIPVTASANIGTKLIASGLEEPVWAESPTGMPDRLWIVEKSGTIRILDFKSGERTLFLDIRDRIKIKMNEQGLLGMAFSKDYTISGRFYVYYTNQKGNSEIVRFTASGEKIDKCDASTGELLLEIPQRAKNHNGGWIDFGPDGYLYISTGDGGSAFDPKNHGQDLTTHLGKILRIDVSPETGYAIPPDNPFIDQGKAKPEIYAYGLRNPWRCSWDRKTNDFYIADVGQRAWEEINFMPAGKGSGANYGWRLREGLIASPKKGVGGEKPNKAIDPIYVYEHSGGLFSGVSVTGGYVYRGSIESIQGKYFFADFANPRVWSFEVKDGKAVNPEDWTDRLKPDEGRLNKIASFAEDHDGELLIISLGGDIFKIVEN